MTSKDPGIGLDLFWLKPGFQHLFVAGSRLMPELSFGVFLQTHAPCPVPPQAGGLHQLLGHFRCVVSVICKIQHGSHQRQGSWPHWHKVTTLQSLQPCSMCRHPGVSSKQHAKKSEKILPYSLDQVCQAFGHAQTSQNSKRQAWCNHVKRF